MSNEERYVITVHGHEFIVEVEYYIFENKYGDKQQREISMKYNGTYSRDIIHAKWWRETKDVKDCLFEDHFNEVLDAAMECHMNRLSASKPIDESIEDCLGSNGSIADT